MDNQLDSESYWNRSSHKGFNFDEDVVDDASSANLGSNILDDSISEASFNFESIATSGSALSLSIKDIIDDDALKTILQEQTLDEKVVSKGITAEEELKSLRR